MKLVAKDARTLKYLLWSLEVPINYTDNRSISPENLVYILADHGISVTEEVIQEYREKY